MHGANAADPVQLSQSCDLSLQIGQRPAQQIGVTLAVTALKLLQYPSAGKQQVALLEFALQFLRGKVRDFG